MRGNLIAAIMVTGLLGTTGCRTTIRGDRGADAEAEVIAHNTKTKLGSGSNPEAIGRITGRTADHPPLSSNPLLSGGAVSRWPLNSNGDGVGINYPNPGERGQFRAAPGCTTRDVALFVQYVPLLDVPPLVGKSPPRQDQQVKQGPTVFRSNPIEYPGIAVLPIAAPRKVMLAEKIILDPIDLAAGADTFSAVRKARRESPHYRKLEATFDGAPHWWVLSVGWAEGASELEPTLFLAELYSADPDGGAAPVDVAVIAKRTGAGPWQSSTGYLVRGDHLMRVTGVIANGLPARVESVEVADPPVEDFLVSKEYSISNARLRTGFLLTAKNRTLPKMLREWTATSLTDLVTRIEKTTLDLNYNRELTHNLAQQAIESGGQPGGLSELSLAYKERIEVLKPILTAIKDEVANRGK